MITATLNLGRWVENKVVYMAPYVSLNVFVMLRHGIDPWEGPCMQGSIASPNVTKRLHPTMYGQGAMVSIFLPYDMYAYT